MEQARAFGSEDLTLDEIRDPNDIATFRLSKLDWQEAETKRALAARALCKRLLETRRDHLVPLLQNVGGDVGEVLIAKDGHLAIDWQLGEHRWQLRANFSDRQAMLPPVKGLAIEAIPSEAEADMRDLSRYPPKSLLFACG